MSFTDVHRTRVPSTWDAGEFTRSVLDGVPGWLHCLLAARDRVVGRFGFRTQPSGSRTVRLHVGATVGPFVLQQIAPDRVVAGNHDPHLAFETSFTVGTDAHGVSGGADHHGSKPGPPRRCLSHRHLAGPPSPPAPSRPPPVTIPV